MRGPEIVLGLLAALGAVFCLVETARDVKVYVRAFDRNEEVAVSYTTGVLAFLGVVLAGTAWWLIAP